MNKRNNSNSNADDPSTSPDTPSKRAKTKDPNRRTADNELEDPLAVVAPFDLDGPDPWAALPLMMASLEEAMYPLPPGGIRNPDDEPTVEDSHATILASIEAPFLAPLPVAWSESAGANTSTSPSTSMSKLKSVSREASHTTATSNILNHRGISEEYVVEDSFASPSKLKSKSKYISQEALHTTAMNSTMNPRQAIKENVAENKFASPSTSKDTLTSTHAPVAKKSAASILAPAKRLIGSFWPYSDSDVVEESTSPSTSNSNSKSTSQEASHASAAQSISRPSLAVEGPIAEDNSIRPSKPESTLARKSVASVIAPTKSLFGSPGPYHESDALEKSTISSMSNSRSHSHNPLMAAESLVALSGQTRNYDGVGGKKHTRPSMSEYKSPYPSHRAATKTLGPPPFLIHDSESESEDASIGYETGFEDKATSVSTTSSYNPKEGGTHQAPAPTTKQHKKYTVRILHTSKSYSLRVKKIDVLQSYDNLNDANAKVARTWNELHGTGYWIYFKGKEEDGRIFWAVFEEQVMEKCEVIERVTPHDPSVWANQKGSGEEVKDVKEWGNEQIRALTHVTASGKIINMEERARGLYIK